MSRPVGRPPKPIEEKRRIGNPGKRPLPDRAGMTILPAAIDPPDPHRPVCAAGRAMWCRVWAAGAGWISPATDAEQVLILCEQIDEREVLRRRVELSPDDWRERGQLRALEAQIMDALSVLGFNPTARSRLGVAEVRRVSLVEQLRREQG